MPASLASFTRRNAARVCVSGLRRSVDENGIFSKHRLYGKDYKLRGSFVLAVRSVTYFVIMNIYSIFSSCHVFDLQVHDECIICFREEYQPTMFMCGHSVVCQDCLADPNFNQCPYCRGPVSPCLLYDCRFCCRRTL